MWKIGCGAVAVVSVLVLAADAIAADVELTRVGNDPQNVWCDTGARQLAQGATLNVQILGRGKKDAPVGGKIRMKSQTDKFEWASGEPTVTFTRTGSSPTSFGVKAKSTAPVGTYSIAFAAVDAGNKESPQKSCSIEVVLASRIIRPDLPGQGPGADLPGPGGLPSRGAPSGQSGAPPPFTLTLSVNPASGATWNTTITLRVVESGTPPPIKACQYRVFPMGGGPEIRSDWVTGCLGWARTLAAGTYLLQVDYKFQMALGQQEFVTAAQLPNYVVAPAPASFSLKLGVAPASGQATSDTPLTMRLLKEGTWNPPSVACTFAAIPTGGGNPWSVGPDSTCAVPSPTLVTGTYTIRLSYRYQKPDGSWGDGSSEVANYVVVPGVRLVEVASIQLDPQQPITGQEVTARMTIKNSGARDLANVPWWILFNDTTIGTGVLSSLPRGGSPPVVTGRLTLRTAGPRRVVGLVDPLNTLGEPTSAQADNRKEFQVTVAQGAAPGGPTAPPPGLLVPGVTVAAPPQPRPVIVDVRQAIVGGFTRVKLTVCNVDPGATYIVIRNGNRVDSWRAGDPRSEFSENATECPSNLPFRARLVFAHPISLSECFATLTYQVVATRLVTPTNGVHFESALRDFDMCSNWFPCPLVPLCTRQEQ